MAMFWRLPSAKLVFLALGMLAITDLLLLPISDFSVAPQGIRIVMNALFMMALLAIIATAIIWRLADDRSIFAAGLNRASVFLLNLSTAGTVVILLVTLAPLSSYLVLGLGMPFQDDLFAAADRALGLDWGAVLRWANSDPLLARVLVYAYASHIAQFAGLSLVFALIGRTVALWEFLALNTVGAILTIATSAFVPALSAFNGYQPDPSWHQTMDAIHPGLGRIHPVDMIALRDGTLKIFELHQAQGIVALPSYHTIMALIFAYSARHLGLLFWPMLVLNGTMIVATVPMGGHYFVDIFAGVAYFALTLVIVDGVNGRAPFWHAWRSHGTNSAPAKGLSAGVAGVPEPVV